MDIIKTCISRVSVISPSLCCLMCSFQKNKWCDKHFWFGQAKPPCSMSETWNSLCFRIHSSSLLKYHTFKWATCKHATTSQLYIPGEPQAPSFKDKSALSIGRGGNSSFEKRENNNYPPSSAKKAVWTFLWWDLEQRTRIQSWYSLTAMQSYSFVDLLTPYVLDILKRCLSTGKLPESLALGVLSHQGAHRDWVLLN